MPKADFENILRNIYLLFDNNDAEVRGIIQYLIVQIVTFQECLKEGNREEIRHAAHKLKGELATIGFKELSNQVSEIEEHFFHDIEKPYALYDFNDRSGSVLTVLNDWLQRQKQIS
jgi:HPt (histidine-containing phosphotransfer) domain-containing protein